MVFVTDGINPNLFAHYAASSKNRKLQAHQYPVDSTNLTGSHQGHKDGPRGARYGQDRAREQSYAMRDQPKEHWRQHRGAALHVATEE